MPNTANQVINALRGLTGAQVLALRVRLFRTPAYRIVRRVLLAGRAATSGERTAVTAATSADSATGTRTALLAALDMSTAEALLLPRKLATNRLDTLRIFGRGTTSAIPLYPVDGGGSE